MNYQKEQRKNGKTSESKASGLYQDVMNLKLKRNIEVRETGIVIQPALFWLAASPDSLFVIDENTDKKYCLIEFKCPASKENISVHELVQDPNFYVYLDNGKPTFKNKHSSGYYSQIQLAMGLSGIKFCDFIVYTYKGIP